MLNADDSIRARKLAAFLVLSALVLPFVSATVAMGQPTGGGRRGAGSGSSAPAEGVRENPALSGVNAIKVFQLKYADASELSQLINSLFVVFDTPGGMGGYGAMRTPPGPAPANGDRGLMGGGAAFAGPILVVSDLRTNSLIVSAPSSALPVIQELITQLDINVDPTTRPSAGIPDAGSRLDRLEKELQELLKEVRDLRSGAPVGQPAGTGAQR
jgi:hypothetical protein